MNHRYVQIIATCLIAGTLTLAMKQNKINCPVIVEKNTLTIHTTKALPKTEDLTITLEPDISSKDLAYKYGFFSYSPTSVSLTVNDEEIEINNSDPIVVKVNGNNTVTTRCKYKFIAGHEGEKVSEQTVKPGGTYSVTFDWDSPEKIQLEGAEVVSAKQASTQEDDENDAAEDSETSQPEKRDESSDNNDDNDDEDENDDNDDEDAEEAKSAQSVAKTEKPAPMQKSMPSYTAKKDIPSFFNNKKSEISDLKV